MKPIICTAIIAGLIATTPMIATAKTPAHKIHATTQTARVTTTTVTAINENPCVDTPSTWTTGNASSRQIKANPATTPPLASCNGLRTIAGRDAATEADMRQPMSAKAAAAADVDDYIGMGNTIPPERK